MNKKKQTFEESLASLEAVIEKLESDGIGLAEAIENFEKGVGLMRECDTHLRGAAGKLKEIFTGENGEFVEKTLGMTLESVLGGEDFNE